MRFDPSEVLTVEDLGEADGTPIKAVSLKGGLCIAVKSAGDKSQVLASASHIGILRHAIKKSVSGFHPTLMKSERDETPFTDYSDLLPAVLTKSGYNLYAIYKNNYTTEYSVTRHNINEFTFTGLTKSDCISLSGAPQESPIVSQAFIPIGKACAKDAIKAGKEFVKFAGKKLPADKLAG